MSKKKILKEPDFMTENILAQYHNEVIRRFSKFNDWKRKPTVKQITNIFNKITKKYALMVENHVKKSKRINVDFKMPKGWKLNYLIN